MHQDEQPQKTCRTCKYWIKNPADPANLAAPPQGECRQSPPSTTIIPQRNGALAILAAYPLLQEGFAACGQHETKLNGNGS